MGHLIQQRMFHSRHPPTHLPPPPAHRYNAAHSLVAATSLSLVAPKSPATTTLAQKVVTLSEGQPSGTDEVVDEGSGASNPDMDQSPDIEDGSQEDSASPLCDISTLRRVEIDIATEIQSCSSSLAVARLLIHGGGTPLVTVRRTFPPAGKHEAKLQAAGLHLFFTIECQTARTAQVRRP